MHGGKQEFDFEDLVNGQPVTVHETITAKLTYLDIPVLAKFAVPSGAARPYLKIGPEVGILLTAKGKVEDSVPVPDSSTGEVDIKDETESLDFRLQFAGGVEVPMGESILGFVEVGFGLGLLDIDKSPNDPGTADSKIKNQGLSISLGMAY